MGGRTFDLTVQVGQVRRQRSQGAEACHEGAGFPVRMLEWQRNRYYFVSCTNCGYTEIYNAATLNGKGDTLRDIIDLLFGG